MDKYRDSGPHAKAAGVPEKGLFRNTRRALWKWREQFRGGGVGCNGLWRLEEVVGAEEADTDIPLTGRR